MLIVPDAWAWDFWTVDDGERLHLFYLNAPRDLGDPGLRHRCAGVGHAVSTDLRPELSAARAATVATGGIWAVTAEPGGDPFDVASAELLVDDRFYVGKLVHGRHGGWVLLAFHHRGPDDTFVGAISDPMPVVMTPGGLRPG